MTRSPPPVRWWQQAVHTPGIYDLEVDTSVLSPEACAAVIRQHVDHRSPPSAFQRLAAMAEHTIEWRERAYRRCDYRMHPPWRSSVVNDSRVMVLSNTHSTLCSLSRTLRTIDYALIGVLNSVHTDSMSAKLYISEAHIELDVQLSVA